MQQGLAETQLDKYLETGLYDMGFEITPRKLSTSKSYLGTISIDDDYRIQVIPPKERFKANDPLSQTDYIEWLTNYMKFYLIANLSNDEFNAFHIDIMGKCLSTQSDIVNLLNSLHAETILARIRGLQNGTI